MAKARTKPKKPPVQTTTPTRHPGLTPGKLVRVDGLLTPAYQWTTQNSAPVACNACGLRNGFWLLGVLTWRCCACGAVGDERRGLPTKPLALAADGAPAEETAA